MTFVQRAAGIFALIVIGTFCGQLGLSIIAPFFPAEAKEKGVEAWGLGFRVGRLWGLGCSYNDTLQISKQNSLHIKVTITRSLPAPCPQQS